MIPAPTQSHQLRERRVRLEVLRIAAVLPASRVGTVEDQMTDPLGMSCRVGGGHRTALRNAEKGKPFEAERIHHGVQVAHPRVEREIRHVPVR
jgi:hypothetical protein